MMSPRVNPVTGRSVAVGYIRVSTTQQVEHGASLDAQEDVLRAEAERRGWDLELYRDEGRSAKDLKRPGLQAALQRLDQGDGHALMAIRIDRVSRSVADFAGLMDRAARRGWEIVMLSPSLDTSDPSGRFTTHVLSAAAEYERALTSVRVREGMARRKSEGVHLGRRSELPAEVVTRIVTERDSGRSLRAIADGLTDEGVTTGQGGARWYASTVKAVLASTTAANVRVTPPKPEDHPYGGHAADH
jgi:DNA invertase Pin-like site-specific DNA recombinase